MIGKTITLSQESETQYIIHQLNLFGIYETNRGDDLSKVDRYTLRSMLAVELAVRE
ncbi:hypothetical protein [Psychrobacillus sp.]|uniref:hypothetical protein n=1 Tax=Psychrobacillus sp. TaxID=1871623 RepID=UPI0028BDC5A9|nr:hypothetical protein [Psychrobacillus sp.]